MKNVTAHYNIYFNAHEQLNESEATIRNSIEDDFNQVLSIYPLPDESSSANEEENLNTVITKVNKIAIEKYESNWLDDAYLLLAEAEYLKRDFYNAIEYDSYVSITFPDENRNKLAAYLGQVKSDFALDLNDEADSVLKLAIGLKSKYQIDDLEASQAELALRKNNLQEAIDHLSKAINQTKERYQKIRWRYILAQLQEKNNEPGKAIANYEKIAKSNAAFEISFNANLSKIRISENQDGKEFDKIATLKKLLKEDKNKEFKEQIYYQIGNAYADKKDLANATSFYSTSIHTLPSTVKQKGIGYLKLAQINFDDLKNYKQSQLYYDSTLQYLPKTYPGYNEIAIKANNLQYLADRLNIIDGQKELLQFSNLSEDDLKKKLDERFVAKTAIDPSQKSIVNNGALTSIQDFSSSNKTAGTFYFYNNAALSQGLSSFKQKWGNRKLADNWRTSSTSLPIEVAKNVNFPGNLGTGVDADLTTVGENVDSLKSRFVKTIPYSPYQKAQSNNKIAQSLYEIAVFYKDVLKDNLEAIEAYDAIVLNYPNQENAASIYYQLYRLTAVMDKNTSEGYKQQLLEKYPGSIYAKTILDPSYGKDEEILKQKVKDYYGSVYTLYKQKKYDEVLNKIAELKSNLGDFKGMDVQYAYLKSLAIGHTQKAPVFLANLNEIATAYPNDVEVTPRVQKQISFIEANKIAFNQRSTALIDYDANDYLLTQPVFVDIPKIEQKNPEPVKVMEQPKVVEVKKEAPVKKEILKEEPKKVLEPEPVKQVAIIEKPKVEKPIIDKVEEKPIIPEPVKPEPVTEKPLPVLPKVIIPEVPKVIVPEKAKGIIFSEDSRQKYLIVLDISDPKQNIAQPFSKLSQYFYSKFDPSSVKLVIRVVGGTEKFVIISGDFYTKEEVQAVSDQLNNNLPQIMEGQTKQYQKFIISEDNLKLLVSKDAVDQYLKFISK
jgi:tetratricopeptide (TPR) repeat protein